MANPYSAPNRHEDERPLQQLAGKVRVLQTITVGLLTGVFVVTGIFLVMNEGVLGDTPELISWIAIGFAALVFVNHLVIPGIVAKTILKNVSADAFRDADEGGKHELLFPAYQTRHIVACAMLESGVFFNLVAYMATEYAGNLVTACVQTAMIAIRFPTATRAQFWIQDHIRELELS